MVIALIVLSVVLTITMVAAAVYGWYSPVITCDNTTEPDSRLKYDNTEYPSITPEIVTTNTYEWACNNIYNQKYTYNEYL